MITEIFILLLAITNIHFAYKLYKQDEWNEKQDDLNNILLEIAKRKSMLKTPRRGRPKGSKNKKK